MAIYHCSVKNISRSDGKSAVASAAYRAGAKLEDRETGRIHNYIKKSEVAYSEIFLCESAPSEYQDRETLWNAVEEVEKQSTARLAREWEVALPNELTLEQSKELVRGYAQSLADEGMCVDANIHWKDGNHHAHIMGTTRPIKENGEWGQKEKKAYKLDENGQKIPQIDPKTGDQKIGAKGRKMWQRETVEANDWNKQEKVEEWRERWADHCNKALEQAQSLERVDYRSFERQGIEQIPTVHEGYAAREIERRGGISDRTELNRKIREKNNILKQLIEQVKDLGKAVADLLHGRSARPSKASIKANKAEMTKIRLEILELKDKREDIEVALKSKALLNANNELIKEYNSCSDKENFAATHPYFYDVINAYRNLKEIAAKWNDGKLLTTSGWEQLAIETDQKISSLYLKLNEKKVVDKELQLALDIPDRKRKNLGSPSL